MLELLKSGEPFLFMNMTVALFALALSVQRFHTLWIKLGVSAEDMLNKILQFVETGSFSRALQVCGGQKKHPMK